MSAASTPRTVKASEVKVGDRIRARGLELTVTRIDDAFLGRENFLAFVEDSDVRWLKVPARADLDVEVL
jgi:hypothetical protein